MPDLPAAQKNLPLKQIAGFELIEKVGQGGMGAVFKARQISLDRVVALKVLAPSIAQNQEFIERFVREARAAGRLNHPHIVQGIDVGLCEKTRLYFFAMEFVDGPSLRQQLKESGALEEEFVRKIARQIGDALVYANQNGLVHRDIKPDNILLNSQGAAKLADLGLAKQIAREDASLTQAGVALGTPFYMAPEQIRGQIDQIDTRTDLYCLGATLFHLVTGQPPYEGATSAVIMAAHLNDKTPLAHQVNDTVSEGFSRLLHALMQKEKARRPVDPKVFLEMLERVDRMGGTTSRALRGVRPGTGPREVVRSTTGPRDRVRSTTGPRERVAGAPGTGQAPGKPRALQYFVVSLVVALLIGGGLLALMLGRKEESGKNAANQEKPVKPPDYVPVKAPPPPPPIWNALEEMANAKKATERNPGDLRGAFNLYERLLADAQREKADAQWIQKITAERDAAKARYVEQVGKARAELAERVKEARAKGQFDLALQALAGFPEDEETERVRLKELAGDLRKEAEGKLNPLLQKAKAALQEGRLDEAATALKEAEASKYEPLAAPLGALRDQLAEARGKLEQKAAGVARIAADEAWGKLLAEFDASVLEKSDLELLRAILKTARENRTLEPRKDDVAILNEVGAKLIEFAEQDRKALASLVGQNVEWTIAGKRLSGRIKSAKGDTVDLNMTIDKAEMTQTIKLGALSAEDQARLRPALNPQGPVEQLAAALSRMRKGTEDRKAAATFIEGAGTSTLASHYRSLIQEQGVAAELAAGKEGRETATKAAPGNPAEKQPEGPRKPIPAEKAGKVAKDQLVGDWKHPAGDHVAFTLNAGGSGTLIGNVQLGSSWSLRWDFDEHYQVLVFSTQSTKRQYKAKLENGAILLYEGREVWFRGSDMNRLLAPPLDKALKAEEAKVDGR